MFPISIVSFGDYVEELGHPYVWVQTLGGLHFPNDSSEVGWFPPDRIASVFVHFRQCYFLFFPRQGARGGSSLSASQMESTMKLLRGRLLSRQALTKQFASLGKWDSVACSSTVQHFFHLAFAATPAAEHSIIPVTSEGQHLFPAKIMSRLARWTPITYEDYKVRLTAFYLLLPMLIQSL